MGAVSTGELGSVIKKVIHYYTLRERFSSVHPELRREGIVSVDVGEEGLHFVREFHSKISCSYLESKQIAFF